MFNRGALDLLAQYSDSDEDDVVPGPKVSTKRSYTDEEDVVHPIKNFARLPVPDAINKLGNIRDDHFDDPNLHDGRQRSFPHERGNWVTYVYIPYEMNAGVENLLDNIQNLLSRIDLKIVDHFHISLTKTVVLKHHWINLFMDTINTKVSLVTRFIIMFDSIRIYCNEERTRTFMGLQIQTGFDSLMKLVTILDGCLDEFKLPAFYKDASFHMSILWCNGDREEELNSHLDELNVTLQKSMMDFSQDNWYILVNELRCKTGNKMFSFNLT